MNAIGSNPYTSAIGKTPPKCPVDLESFVTAIKEGRAHLIMKDSRLCVHVGSRETMGPSVGYAFNFGEVPVLGNITCNANNGWLDTGTIKIPLKLARINEAIEYLQAINVKLCNNELVVPKN